MDIKALLGDETLYTLHSHTQFCDGRAPMEDFARKAAAMGFKHYGFSPHSPIPFYSTCNMKKEDVPAFLAEVDRLQAMFPSVRFYKSMEIDYIGDSWNAASQYFRDLPLDYTISSIHFIPNQKGEMVDIDGRFEHFKEQMETKFEGDIEYVVEKFFEQSIRMVETGGFDIIGHFDKIKHNGGLYMPGLEKTDLYNSLVDRLIDKIEESGIAVEINTKAWTDHQQLYPAQRHWKRLIADGVTLVVNSDAHYPDKINASRVPVLKSLDYIRKQTSI